MLPLVALFAPATSRMSGAIIHRQGMIRTALLLVRNLLHFMALDLVISREPCTVCRCGLCLGGLRLSEKPSTQTQLAIDG